MSDWFQKAADVLVDDLFVVFVQVIFDIEKQLVGVSFTANAIENFVEFTEDYFIGLTEGIDVFFFGADFLEIGVPADFHGVAFEAAGDCGITGFAVIGVYGMKTIAQNVLECFAQSVLFADGVYIL